MKIDDLSNSNRLAYYPETGIRKNIEAKDVKTSTLDPPVKRTGLLFVKINCKN
jgi:hypothetical protein